MVESQKVSDIDFDLLVGHVENTISEDKQRHQAAFTPQELMLRSNPALFSWENFATSDLTNPRDMYNILSSKTKSIEDLEAKLKKELVKSVQMSNTFPKLSRAVSMGDLEHKHGKGLKISDSNNRQMNMLFLKRHNTSLADGCRKGKDSDKENNTALNLPHIENQLNCKGDLQKVKDKTEHSELPALVSNTQQVRQNDQKQEASNDKHVSFADTKLDKWFSEMPNEVFDKAQRALMEESIQARLQEFRRSRCRKMNFPNQSFNVCIGSKHRRVTNTYLELRVDSFGRHLQTEKDERRNRYRLQQKSMHNLKMRESVEGEPNERLHRENTFPKLSRLNKPFTPVKPKSKTEQELTATQKHKKESAKIQSERGFKTLYINDKFGVEIGQKLGNKHGISNYEDYTERLFAMKEMQYQDLLNRLVESPSHSEIDPDEENINEDILERENTKATVVNLELNKESPHTRKPLHIEKSLIEASKTKNEFLKDKEFTAASESENMKNLPEPTLKQDKIITKIPTAPSVRTSESRSSNSSFMSKNNKEAMKKFNKLEVFAESHRVADINPHFRNFSEHRSRQFGESHEALNSLPQNVETKQPQHQIPNQTEVSGLLKEIQRPEADVVFRFEPGEVFVSRKNPNKTLTKTLSSERARVIYGKVAQNSVEKKMHNDKSTGKKETTKDNYSCATKSTKHEHFYRTEVGRFESRAVDGSTSPNSPRLDHGNDQMLIITSNKRLNPGTVTKHDVATETDVIGSPGPKYENRSESGLSDFIIDNNDGESLESDYEEDHISPDMRQKSNHSV